MAISVNILWATFLCFKTFIVAFSLLYLSNVTVTFESDVTSWFFPWKLAQNLFLLMPPVEDHMMLLHCCVMFHIWLQGKGPNSEQNGVFVQHGSSLKAASMHMAAPNKVVKMSPAASPPQQAAAACQTPSYKWSMREEMSVCSVWINDIYWVLS